jgi:guanine deaminase
MNHEHYLLKSIEVAKKGMLSGVGGPFGAIIVKDNKVVSEASNGVTSLNDPTAHAEIQAIRKACQVLGNFQLNDCILYSSCEPCPMCLGAIYWARPTAVYFAATRFDAAAGGFDDEFIYKEIGRPGVERQIQFTQITVPNGNSIFSDWNSLNKKTRY